ncbi:hypothetical protein BT63DRAFT_194642 [Microthyrium microscopicum]|uniref:Uncharacterized protein n=1 Tax=Microthyrium microscopicum TaxID=703497 RepID=A0A6A6UJB1_9PEZI|nr:hypothetical protein BT63DRAFT_194642 [Microthyrium microscopicum]
MERRNTDQTNASHDSTLAVLCLKHNYSTACIASVAFFALLIESVLLQFSIWDPQQVSRCVG